jgi:RecG-like helicase
LNLIKRNEVDIIFGSVKLLRQTKLWENVHLVVSEEIGIPENLSGRGQISEKDEGRFGTTIRMPLFQAKDTPNLLVYTPIPLPIVLIESLYPTFTISTITSKDDIPKSSTFPFDQRTRAYKHLLSEVQHKRQGYIVLPQKGHDDVFSLTQTLDFAQALNKEFLPNVKLGIFSSHMSREDKIRVFDDYQRRRIDLFSNTLCLR